MEKLYERLRSENNVTKEISENGVKTEIKGVETTKDVILAGNILTNDAGENVWKKKISSKSRKPFVNLSLTPFYEESEDFGTITRDVNILFFNTTSTQYGPSPKADIAERILKHAFPGEAVIVKAQEVRTEWEDGSADVSYFGTTLLRKGQKTSYKINESGPGVIAVLGSVVLNEQDDGTSVSVPLSVFDSKLKKELVEKGTDEKDANEQARFTNWIQVKDVNPDDSKFSRAEDGKCAICAFVCAPKKYEEIKDETTGQVIDITMTPDYIIRLN